MENSREDTYITEKVIHGLLQKLYQFIGVLKDYMIILMKNVLFIYKMKIVL